jgi:hypothetical protein
MGNTNTPTLANVGIAGTVSGYGVLVLGDLVVIRDGEDVARRTVDGIDAFATHAIGLRLGWGQFPDDAEVIFTYDRADNTFGFAVNLDCGWCDEWGYAPFATAA